MALIIAGERSGVGKTTVTLALLACLSRRKVRVQSFKVGPDYIDPMFHRFVTGRSCRNLDPVLTSERYVQQCFFEHGQSATHVLIEGVMGLFDGAANYPSRKLHANRTDYASTAHIARLLNLPVLLVLDCSRLSHSIAALVHGYRSFDPRVRLAGVVLNRVGSDRHLELLQSALAPLDVPILGILRRQDSITIPDRHLGLVPTAELDNLTAVIDRLAALGESCFDWARLMPLLEERGDRGQRTGDREPAKIQKLNSRIRVAIAQDEAFSFYYTDNLDVLEQLGAELVLWSPLRDAELPQGTQGLYFGGGFPEVFAGQLAENRSALRAVRAAIEVGMPTYAECGGLMYLCQGLTDFAGESFAMAGVLPTQAVMGSRLTLGYRQATAQQDSALVRKHQQVWGHEFHRSFLTLNPIHPLFQINHPQTPEGWCVHHLHASYLHLHWGDRPELPARFLEQCQMGQ